MIAFVPFRQMDAEVDHVNHDRTDNRRDNLRWLSPGLNRVYWNGRREDGTIIWSTLAEMEPPEPVEPMTAEEQAAWAAEAAEQGW